MGFRMAADLSNRQVSRAPAPASPQSTATVTTAGSIFATEHDQPSLMTPSDTRARPKPTFCLIGYMISCGERINPELHSLPVSPQPPASASAPDPLAPGKETYIAARAEWNERYGSYIQQARFWRLAFFMSAAVSVMSVGGVVLIGSQSRLVPYIVEVNQLGDALAAEARGCRIDAGHAPDSCPARALDQRYAHRSISMRALSKPSSPRLTGWSIARARPTAI